MTHIEVMSHHFHTNHYSFFLFGQLKIKVAVRAKIVKIDNFAQGERERAREQTEGHRYREKKMHPENIYKNGLDLDIIYRTSKEARYWLYLNENGKAKMLNLPGQEAFFTQFLLKRYWFFITTLLPLIPVRYLENNIFYQSYV